MRGRSNSVYRQFPTTHTTGIVMTTVARDQGRGTSARQKMAIFYGIVWPDGVYYLGPYG